MTSREALTLGTEAELPNSLPGDDQDECLLLPGELCQHLCINTVGSYRCACFPGFELQGDGRTCRPGELSAVQAQACPASGGVALLDYLSSSWLWVDAGRNQRRLLALGTLKTVWSWAWASETLSRP